jgi:hypothetical protein
MGDSKTSQVRPMIRFPQRAALIQQAQGILALKQDGKDGQTTWHALATRFLPSGHPIFNRIGAAPSGHDFPSRESVVAAVQSAVGADVDGDDGAQTWSAIMESLAPSPARHPVRKPIHGYPETVRGRSPNRNAGKNLCKGIVLHHAAGYFEGTIDWCLREKTHAAYHCLISEDGTRAILGHDTDRLHHAGASSFKGLKSCNNFMLGIAFVGNTNTGAMRRSKDLSMQEIASAVEWIDLKMQLHGISRDWITHHRVISPGRKDDLSLDAWADVCAGLGF